MLEFHEKYKHQESLCYRKLKLPIDDNKKRDKKIYQDYVLSMVKKKNQDIKAIRRLENHLGK